MQINQMKMILLKRLSLFNAHNPAAIQALKRFIEDCHMLETPRNWSHKEKQFNKTQYIMSTYSEIRKHFLHEKEIELEVTISMAQHLFKSDSDRVNFLKLYEQLKPQIIKCSTAFYGDVVVSRFNNEEQTY